jgi:hypothetical protein
MTPDAHEENVLPIRRLNAPPALSLAIELSGCTFLNMWLALALDAAATAAQNTN